jgi:hypothetical protein
MKDNYKQTKTNSVAWVCKQTIPTEQPLLVGEVSASQLLRLDSVT